MNKVFFGDCRDVMRHLIADGVKVQMCVTSPPYWGLRDYGHPGQLGLEDSPEEYIDNMVGVFRLVRDLLADDGTLWLNMGDSYAGSRPGADIGSTLQGSSNNQKQVRTAKMVVSRRRDNELIPRNDVRIDGIKPKDLVGMPWMLAFALRADGWYLRQDIVWNKPNPMPESVRDRCTKAHEYIFLMSKRGRYFFDFEAFQEPVSGGAHARAPGNTSHKYTDEYEKGDERHRMKAGLVKYADKFKTPDGWDTTKGKGSHGSFHKEWREKGHTGYQHKRHGVHPKSAEPGSGIKANTSFSAAVHQLVDKRNRRSVWTVATQPYSGAHFATFPPGLIEPCILAGSRPGDIVFDPFFGSGTTGEVAQRLGRQWIGCEINEDYEPLQKERTAQGGLLL